MPKDKSNKTKSTAEPYPKKGGIPEGDTQEDSLYCDRCTSAVNQSIQSELCLCSACEKIPESIMSTVSEYNQIHWFCQYCDALVG